MVLKGDRITLVGRMRNIEMFQQFGGSLAEFLFIDIAMISFGGCDLVDSPRAP
jgi:hypothetical protein